MGVLCAAARRNAMEALPFAATLATTFTASVSAVATPAVADLAIFRPSAAPRPTDRAALNRRRGCRRWGVLCAAARQSLLPP